MTGWWRSIALTAAALAACALLVAAPEPPKDAPAEVPRETPAPKLTEKPVKSLGKVDERALEPLVISPDGTRLAYVVDRDAKGTVIVCDGKESREYKSVYRTNTVFSSDSKRWVYWAWTGPPNARCLCMCDGVEVDHANVGFLVFSPDGKHTARAGGDMVFRDGISQKEGVCSGTTFVFSPDSQHLAYVARRADRGICCDGRMGLTFKTEALGDPVWTPDSKSYAYTVSQGDKIGDKWVVFWKDKKVAGPYDMVEGLTVAPDSKRIAWRAFAKDKWSVVVNDKKGPDFSQLGAIVFSILGNHMAYRACDKDGWCIVLDGKKGPTCTDLGDPVFSSDGKHLAYRVVKDGKSLVICDGRESAPFDQITWVGFTPNSNHLAFAAVRGKDNFVVCDGVEGPPHERLMVPERALESPDKLRYVVIEKGEASLVEADWPAGRIWENAFKPEKAP